LYQRSIVFLCRGQIAQPLTIDVLYVLRLLVNCLTIRIMLYRYYVTASLTSPVVEVKFALPSVGAFPSRPTAKHKSQIMYPRFVVCISKLDLVELNYLST